MEAKKKTAAIGHAPFIPPFQPPIENPPNGKISGIPDIDLEFAKMPTEKDFYSILNTDWKSEKQLLQKHPRKAFPGTTEKVMLNIQYQDEPCSPDLSP